MVLVQIVSAEPPASSGELLNRRYRQGANDHRARFVADIDHPDGFGPVLAAGPDRLVADYERVLAEQRQNGVREAGHRRVVVEAAHHLGPALVGDVEDDGATLDVTDGGQIGRATGRA